MGDRLNIGGGSVLSGDELRFDDTMGISSTALDCFLGGANWFLEEATLGLRPTSKGPGVMAFILCEKALDCFRGGLVGCPNPGSVPNVLSGSSKPPYPPGRLEF